MKALFSLLRMPNLIIIGITLCLLYVNAKEPSLDGLSFLILCLGTICIAGAGNVINDILDVEIDLINKKDKVVIGRLISVQKAWKLYWFLNLFALALAICLKSIDLLFFFSGAILYSIFILLYGNGKH